MTASSSSNLRVEYVPEPLSPGRSRSRNGRQYFGEAAVDIIAVQGLGSTYDWTWSAEVPGSQERYYWLRSSICKEMPDARVLAFEYDTRWLGDTDNVSLFECGSRLLRAILRDRAHAGDSRMCPTRSRRPIMFIGHSFGGLVIKQSIVIAGETEPDDPNYNDHQAFLMAITSVFFLGTPHTGSSFPSLARIKILVSRAVGVDSEERLLSLLRTGSEELKELQKKFGKVKYLDKAKTVQENEPATELYCYYEQKKMRLGPFPTGYVVTEDSACLKGATNRGMEADHMGLNKFKSDDKNYDVTLKADLLREYARCAHASEDRFTGCQYGSERANPELHRLNQKLLPTVLTHRTRRDFKYQEQQRIRTHPPTCSWIADVEAFQRWRSSSDFSCLWIHGKAGSGKSVLASYITKLLQPDEHDQSHDSRRCKNLLSSDFCSARNATGPAMVYFLCGVDPALESPASMLGALIHQLLFRFDEDRRLQSITLSTLRKVKAQAAPQELASLFMEVASLVGRVYVVIDGLDENKEYVRVLEEFTCLAGNPCIKLLFLSRNVYDVEQHLRRSFRTVQDFDIIQYSGQDINAVAEFRTEELVVLKPELGFQRQIIENYLKKNAEGVFLWLGAARDQLDRSCTNPDDVEKTLDGLYPEMNHMYGVLISGLYQRENVMYRRTRVRSALKWLCASPKSMTVSNLRALMLLEDHYDGVTLEAIEDTRTSDARAAEELKALLGSTIDILESPDGILMVQICHNTLKEFLTHEDAPTDLGFIFSMSSAHTHCARISMSICGVSFVRLCQRSNQLAQSEIVEYAWQFWAYHFHNSGLDFGAPIMAQSFDRMVAASFEETLYFLEGVAHFLCQKFEMTEIMSGRRLEFVRSFQEAQRTLAPPLKKMVYLCKNIPLSEELQRLRAEQDSTVEARRRTLKADDKKNLHQVVAYILSFRGKQSRLSLLSIDSFLPPSLLRAEWTVHHLLADIARGLRMAAANIAPDPIYKEMMDLSEGSLKPITALVQVSNFLETMAGFPYWDQCPPSLNPLHAFDIEDKDPYAMHAGLVRARVGMTEKHPWDVQPLHLMAMTVPRSLSTAQWHAALLSYRLFFSSQTSLYKTFVMNPLAQAHARHFMYLDHIKGGGVAYLADPATALMAHLPRDYEDAPFRAFLVSLPAFGLVLFTKYIEVLTRPVGRYAWPVLQVQWGRIKVNCTHLRTFIGFAKLTWSPKSTISYIHWVFGVAAYLVRRRYFLWFGGHSAPHPIRDIVNCFTNPLAFWETNTYDWWWWAKYIFWQNVGNGILYLCIGQTRRGTHAFLPSVFVTFWALCVLERGVCAIVNATCVPLSLISFVFQDAEMVKEFVKLSLRYWSVSLLAIINWGTGLLATTRLGGWGMLLMLLLTAGFLWSIVSFQDAFWDSFFTLIYPLRMGLWVAIRGALLVYLPVLKFVGIVLTLIMMFAGAAFFTSFCADPLQLKDTKALTEAAARRARNMLPTRQPFRIGEYTGAGRRARSPTRASTNLSAWTSPAASASPQPVPQPRHVYSAQAIGPRRPFVTDAE